MRTKHSELPDLPGRVEMNARARLLGLNAPARAGLHEVNALAWTKLGSAGDHLAGHVAWPITEQRVAATTEGAPMMDRQHHQEDPVAGISAGCGKNAWR